VRQEVLRLAQTFYIAAVVKGVLTIVKELRREDRSGFLSAYLRGGERGNAAHQQPHTTAAIRTLYARIERELSKHNNTNNNLHPPPVEEVNEVRLVTAVLQLVVPYLRQTALFLHYCLGYASLIPSTYFEEEDEEEEDDVDMKSAEKGKEKESESDSNEGPKRRVQEAKEFLREGEWHREECVVLSSLIGLPREGWDFLGQGDGGVTASLVASWYRKFLTPKDKSRKGVDDVLRVLPSAVSACPFEFHRESLPLLYQELPFFKEHAKNLKCRRCRTSPKHPALCLLCGELLCFDADCCRYPRGIGECNQVQPLSHSLNITHHNNTITT